jgi:hypothetical protein
MTNPPTPTSDSPESILPPAPAVSNTSPVPAAISVMSVPAIELKITHAGDADGNRKGTLEIVLLIISSLLSPALILVFGYILTGKVDQLFKEREQALKEREFHSENIHQMQQFLTDLEDPDVKREKAHASAVAIAVYGSDAIPLLLHVLTEDSAYGGEAAQDGLLALEPEDAPSACKKLADILKIRVPRYGFPAHRRVLRAMRDLDCREQMPGLREYSARLKAGPPYPFRGTTEGQPPLKENVDSVSEQLTRTVDDLSH